MRAIKQTMLVSGFCLFLFSSCKKESDAVLDLQGGSLSMQLDGVSKKAVTVVANYDKSDKSIILVAPFSTGGGESLTITLDDVKAGSFDAGDGEVEYTANGADLVSGSYSSVSGSVVISALTATTVKGTFNVVAENILGVKKQITTGVFESKLTSL